MFWTAHRASKFLFAWSDIVPFYTLIELVMSHKWVITDIFTSYKGRKGLQTDHGILPLEKWITGFKFGKNFKEGPMISVWLVPGDHNHTY